MHVWVFWDSVFRDSFEGLLDRLCKEHHYEPRSQNVSIRSQHKHCQISLKIVYTRSQNSS